MRSENYVMGEQASASAMTIVLHAVFRLPPCSIQFQTLWLRSGTSEFNISVISSKLDFFKYCILNHAVA